MPTQIDAESLKTRTIGRRGLSCDVSAYVEGTRLTREPIAPASAHCGTEVRVMTRTIPAAVLAAVLTVPTAALGEPPGDPARATPQPMPARPGGPIASTARRLAALQSPAAGAVSPGAPSSRRRRAARKTIGAIAGGVGGFFAGGFIGAKLEPDCRCDDPGFKGFLIGAPIGAAAGAVIGSMVD
jgi:hypothetical protein